MTKNKKIWYQDGIAEAIDNFYEDIRKGGKRKPVKQSNNIKALSIPGKAMVTVKNNNTFSSHSTFTAPPVEVLSLFI